MRENQNKHGKMLISRASCFEGYLGIPCTISAVFL